MTNLIETLKFHFLDIFLIPSIIALFAVIIVTISWIVDYYSGIRKAKERGEDLYSNGFRRSIIKASEYYKYMIYGVMFDFFLILIMYALDVPLKILLPFFTMGFSAFILRIEYKSFKEKATEKVRHQMPNINIGDILRQPDARARVIEILNQIEKDNQNNEGDKQDNYSL